MTRHSLLRRVALPLLVASAVSVVPAIAGTTQQPQDHLRVMSFNVRYAAPGDGINVWENRRDLMVKTILQRHPDIVGTQELLLSQASYLQSKLTGYAWFGKGRNGNEIDENGNEHMGVFYDTARLKVLEHGDFWYSDTPDVPGSPNFGQALPRMATWAKFEDRRTGHTFWFFDTHFPHMADAEPVRERCARLLMERIGRLPAGAKVIVTGDFNSSPETVAHQVMTSGMKDAWDAAPAHKGPELTVHAFTGKPHKRIDYVFVRGFTADKVEVADDHEGKVFPSDHYPVIADLSW